MTKTELRITCPACGWHTNYLPTMCDPSDRNWLERYKYCSHCANINDLYQIGHRWEVKAYTVHSLAVWYKPWTWFKRAYVRKQQGEEIK